MPHNGGIFFVLDTPLRLTGLECVRSTDTPHHGGAPARRADPAASAVWAPLFAGFTTYMRPLSDSPFLTYEHLRSPVLRSHSDVDGRAAVCVEENSTPSRQREKAEKVLRAIGARP